MAKNNLNILFWLFKAKTNRKGETPIYLRISYVITAKTSLPGSPFKKTDRMYIRDLYKVRKKMHYTLTTIFLKLKREGDGAVQ